jgi:hypothetical protein
MLVGRPVEVARVKYAGLRWSRCDGARASSTAERSLTMTDTPSPPDDSNPTTRYDPPPPEDPVVPADAQGGALDAPTSPPPASTPPPLLPPPTAPPPTWRSRRDDPGRTGSIIFGVILLAVGLWFFADQTLGLDMPRLRWSELWPLLIIAIGAWVVLASMRRGR